VENWSRRISFKVDIAGVIEIMGSSLYSRMDTPVRELIQNAHDAVIRRRQQDLDYQGRIDIRQDAQRNTLSFHDDGIGLSPDEAEQYLGTLGIGITGLLKRRGPREVQETFNGDSDALIGQFGIGLFSAFMLADRITVESRRLDCETGVRWEAGAGTEIELAASPREETGTSITLHLKPEYQQLSESEEKLEEAIKLYADFLPVPIFLNDGKARVNVIHVAWFDPSPEREQIELEFEGYFNETPLDIIPVQLNRPATICGALYVTPHRLPLAGNIPVVAVTIRRMVISRHVHDLLPVWAPFLRGVLELQDCSPTASREDLVRDEAFERVQYVLEQHLYEHFERMVVEEPARFEAIVHWHRYTMAAAALADDRLRLMLRRTYRWPTSQGQLTFEEILARSPSDPLADEEADFVVWYNSDRRQERWVNEVFDGHAVPCVHAVRGFEEPLLAALVADTEDGQADLRITSPSATGFATSVLGIVGTTDAPQDWLDFLGVTDAKILTADFTSDKPVMAFLNERYELAQVFVDLKKDGSIPQGFQRLIDSHFRSHPTGQNEIVLNRSHRVVKRALKQGTTSPLASVVRLLVINALSAAGASIPQSAHKTLSSDLDWVADALWGKDDA
jgi:hypothetical protein